MTDSFVYSNAKVVVAGVDVDASKVEVFGLNVVTSPNVPPGKAYIVDPAAFNFEPITAEFTSTFEAGSSAAEFFESLKYRAQMRYSIDLGTGTTLERDPLSRPIPHTFRGVWRLMRTVAGYEWRKATARPRRVPVRRSCAVITGFCS